MSVTAKGTASVVGITPLPGGAHIATSVVALTGLLDSNFSPSLTSACAPIPLGRTSPYNSIIIPGSEGSFATVTGEIRYKWRVTLSADFIQGPTSAWLKGQCKIVIVQEDYVWTPWDALDYLDDPTRAGTGGRYLYNSHLPDFVIQSSDFQLAVASREKGSSTSIIFLP